jgi:hypothetical protein
MQCLLPLLLLYRPYLHLKLQLYPNRRRLHHP